MQQAIDSIKNIMKIILDEKAFSEKVNWNYSQWAIAIWNVFTRIEMEIFHWPYQEGIQSLWDGWIPVTERLPENSNDILLRWIFWYVNTAIWRYHHTGENWFVLPNTVGFYKTENVTHWMPLPNSPKQ